MLIYNITTKVLHQIATGWLDWVRDEYIPQAMASGCVSSARILRLEDAEDEDGPTFAIQLEIPDRKAFETYLQNHAEVAVQQSFARWGNQFITFKSVLSVVN
jgi:hypothetical protein